MRAIMATIISALKATFRFVGRVLATPLRTFGGGQEAPPEVQMPQRFVDDETEDRSQIYDDIARVVMGWAADSIIAGRPMALPPGLPIAVREWLPGLSREECWELMEADKMAVSSHLLRHFTLPRVRTVQRLPRIDKWPAETAAPSASFAAIAALETGVPCRA